MPQRVRRDALGDARQNHLGRGDGAVELTGVIGLIGFWPGKSQTSSGATCHQSRNSSSSCSESITVQSRCPLPLLVPAASCAGWFPGLDPGMSDTFRFATSDTRRPAP